MRLTVGVVMDPIGAISYKKDTTLALLLAVQARDWELHYFEQSDLYLQDGRAWGRSRLLEVRADPQNWYQFHGERELALDELDVILMRKDPPFDMEYVYTTYLLERAEAAGTLVVNKPQSLRDANEKLYTAWFPQCCPPSLVTRSHERVKAFLAEHGDIVVKPPEGMGGAKVFRLRPDDPNINVILENLTGFEHHYLIAQRYLPEIREGDKRILLIDGEPIPYALARMAAPGETRANLAVGGRGVGVELSERDRWICAQVGPVARERGLIFVGLDVIGDYLTEINVTSPTCVRELDAQYGLDIGAELMTAIEHRLR
ncbi:MAG: glutathione synthase [Candidatus Competibacterales bacterium]|nr:glutathione synthase [Candidatus Competibacterales bacterium]